MAPGSFTPSCEPDGSYSRKQCHGSTGQCWCVHTQTGEEIHGTRAGPYEADVNCQQGEEQEQEEEAFTMKASVVYKGHML